MNRRLLWLSLIAVIAYPVLLHAQEYRSIHEVEHERHAGQVEQRSDGAEAGRPSVGWSRHAAQEKALTHEVFGWYPYWMASAYTQFDYSLLSTIAYFSYEVDTATGSYTTLRQWKTTDLVPYAHERGVRVVLTVTNFGNARNAAVLRSPQKRRTLIDSLVAVVGERQADGVNIDFEGITDKTLRDSLTAFMRELSARFHALPVPQQVSMALPAVDWSGIVDVQALAQYVDLCILMGYDYHWSSAPQAGPVAPLDSSALWGKYSVLRSVRTYLAAGLPANKLLLGVPYYGYEWPVESQSIPAATTGPATSYQYYRAVARAAEHGRRWDAASATPFYLHTTDNRQGWYEDAASLALKYDGVLSYGLGGVGIWALGYDGERPELWELLRETFTRTTGLADGEAAGTPRAVYDNDRLVLLVHLPSACAVQVEVFDPAGRLLLQRDCGIVPAGTQVLDVTPLYTPRGVVAVRVRTGAAVWHTAVCCQP